MTERIEVEVECEGRCSSLPDCGGCKGTGTVTATLVPGSIAARQVEFAGAWLAVEDAKVDRVVAVIVDADDEALDALDDRVSLAKKAYREAEFSLVRARTALRDVARPTPEGANDGR